MLDSGWDLESEGGGEDWVSLDMATDLTADVGLYWDQEKIIPFYPEVCVEVYVVSGIRV